MIDYPNCSVCKGTGFIWNDKLDHHQCPQTGCVNGKYDKRIYLHSWGLGPHPDGHDYKKWQDHYRFHGVIDELP